MFGIIFMVFAVLFWLMMVRELLLLLVRQKRLPQFVGTFLFSEFEFILARFIGWFASKARHLGMKLLYWSLAILVLVQIFVWADLFRQANFTLANYFIPWVSRSPDKASAAVALEVSLTDDPFRRDPALLRTILEQLKAAGAKAIAVDYQLARWSARRALVQSGRSVLLLPPGMHYFVGDSIPEGHATLNYFMKGSGSIFTLIPRMRSNEADATLELIKIMRGYGDDLPIRQIGNNVVFGDYEIPVENDGTLYLDLNNDTYPDDAYSTSVYVWQNRRTGELWYRNNRSGVIDTAGLPLAEKYANRFRGKVVFLVRSSEFGLERPSFNFGPTYAKAFVCMLDKDYLVKSGWYHLGLTAVFLFLSGLIAKFLRPLYAFPLLIAVAAGSFLLGHWLFHVQRIFIELAALLVATSLAAVVFPFVRYAHDLQRMNRGATNRETEGSTAPQELK